MKKAITCASGVAEIAEVPIPRPKEDWALVNVGPALDRLITHILPMSRVQEAFELQVSGRCGKVVLKPWE